MGPTKVTTALGALGAVKMLAASITTVSAAQTATYRDLVAIRNQAALAKIRASDTAVAAFEFPLGSLHCCWKYPTVDVAGT